MKSQTSDLQIPRSNALPLKKETLWWARPITNGIKELLWLTIIYFIPVTLMFDLGVML